MDNKKDNITANNDNIQVLRTYTSDMADVIRNNEMTVAKIAMEEKRKKEEESLYQKAEGTKTSKIIFLIGGIILITIAIIGIYLVTKKSTQIPTTMTSLEKTETFISYDSSAEIDVTNITNLSGLINLIDQSKENSKTIKVFFLTEKISEQNGKEEKEKIQPISTSDFLELIGSNIPRVLMRTFNDNYLLGEYTNINNSTNNKPAMFLMFKTLDYNQAYASMLDWEKSILKDLYNLFDIKILNAELFDKPWSDILIDNRDVRVLYDENNVAVLYYTFINKNELIIATNIDSLREVISRLLIKNN